jgi:peptidoglycan/xylan/chitin deacetylase (PgdA/CDA1 family)
MTMAAGRTDEATAATAGPPAALTAQGGPRFAVFSANLSASVCCGLLALHHAWPAAEWLVVLHRPRRNARTLIRSQMLNLRRNGWRWIPYQVGDIGRRLLARRRPVAATSSPWQRAWTAFLARPAMTVIEVDDMSAASSLRQVEAFKPDLGLSLAAPILKRTLFALPRLGTINLHKGSVPQYRGMPPAFWELWNEESSVGCTVHWVDDRLDTGEIVKQDTIARDRYSTLRGLQLQLDELGIRLVADAVQEILAGHAKSFAQPPGGRTYRKPTLAQATALENRLAALQPPGQSALRRAARDSVATLMWGAGKAGLWRSLQPRITVILYHRVTDEARDNLSVGIEQFDRQMALLREHCELLSLPQVLACGAIPRSARPLVAVTFDDGYLDNYVHATPVLLRHGVPAAFFVSTGMIGTQQRFPHDVKRGNPPLATMSWDQLKRMHEQGFTIGSHSVSHIDCAAEPREKVVEELRESLDHLRQRLGTADPVFAYPYGGRSHMTAERLRCVREAGYVGCLSAYGGSNIGSVDPYNVVRRGIHWEFTDKAFMLECLGLR